MSEQAYWCDECQAEFGSKRHVQLAHPNPGPFRWRQRRWWSWLSMKMYALGITSSGHHAGHADGWIVRNFYRGKRPYILGLERGQWGYPWHFVRYRHWPLMVWGFCGKCGPWQCCGEVGYEHAEGCEEAA